MLKRFIYLSAAMTLTTLSMQANEISSESEKRGEEMVKDSEGRGLLSSDALDQTDAETKKVTELGCESCTKGKKETKESAKEPLAFADEEFDSSEKKEGSELENAEKKAII